MYAVMGVTGNIGSQLASNLLAAGQKVRVVVRDTAKGDAWKSRGCEIAVGDIYDSGSLIPAFHGVEGVFVLVPPVFDPALDFAEAHAVAKSLRAALESVRPQRVVYLSTIGAQAKQSNLLTQHTIIETALRDLSTPVAFLRPGWFMENFAWDVAPARETGVIPGFLQPLDKPVPMVATADIAEVAAELLRESRTGQFRTGQSGTGNWVVELEGPRRVTPNEVAATFGRLLGRTVTTGIVPRANWDTMFRAQGMKNPEPRIRMLDGFNEGWIEFESGAAGSRKGKVELEAVLRKLIER